MLFLYLLFYLNLLLWPEGFHIDGRKLGGLLFLFASLLLFGFLCLFGLYCGSLVQVPAINGLWVKCVDIDILA